MTCRSTRDGDRPRCEDGFTVIEMMMALTIIAVALFAIVASLLGGLKAAAAARQRSAFVEVANAEMESVRGLPWGQVGVLGTDSDFSAAYPSGQYNGRDAVVLTGVSGVPAAVTIVTSNPPVRNVALPYTVRRWVTWTDASAGTGHDLKRLNVQVEWAENAGPVRRVGLTSLLYPGGLGTSRSSATDPTFTTISVPRNGTTTSSVNMSATALSPAGYSPLTYSWNFGDGLSATVAGANRVSTPISHTYTSPGEFVVQVVVTDGNGGEAAGAAQSIFVTTPSGGSNPSASFTVDPDLGVAPLTVSVNGSASTDPGGSVLSYDWNWGDGTAHSGGVSATHTFTSAGSFEIVLTVTNTSGNSGRYTSTVTTTPLNCAFGSPGGFLTNPPGGATPNDIRVASNGVPTNQSIVFTASTNSACTSVSARISYSDGTALLAPLALQSDIGGVRTWSTTATATRALAIANNQTALLNAAGLTANPTYTFSYNVHQ